MNDEEERAAREAERRRLEKERQILEAEKEAKSLIPLNKDYEKHIFNYRYVDWDCSDQSENSVAILLSGYSFVSLRHETMASITDSIS